MDEWVKFMAFMNILILFHLVDEVRGIRDDLKKRDSANRNEKPRKSVRESK